MKNRTTNLRRLIDKYSTRYGEQDPIVIDLKNQLEVLESDQKVIVVENVKPFPSSRQRLEQSKDLESIAG
jgi:uncharacterized protein involved in exopolysaccharide biosynthesis